MNIDINIKGGGGQSTAAEIRQTTTEVRSLIQALRELRQASQGGFNIATGVAGGAPSGVPVNMAQGAAQARVQSAAPSISNMATQANQQAAQSANTATASMNNYGTSIDRARHKVAELRRELEGLDRIRSAGSNTERYRAALQIAGPHNAPTMMARAVDPEHYAGVEARLADAEAVVQRHEDRRTRYQAQLARNSQRVEEQRLAREQAEQMRAIREQIATERAMAFQARRDNMDRLWGGMVLSGAGTATLGALGAAAGQFGQAQMTRVGLQAVEGGNAANVERQAREMALNTFGASYRDILQYQNQLRIAELPLERAQGVVKSFNDINAALGGTGESMGRLVYNLEQVAAVGHLTGQEMRDFARNRLNLRPFIAREMGIQVGDVEGRISKGEVTSDIVIRAIMAMGQDPRFRGRAAQITESTLPGQWEKTREEMQQTAEIAGEALAPALGTLNRGLRGLLELARNNPWAIRGGALGAGAFGLGAAAIGGVALTQYGLGTVGQMMPDRWMQNPIMSRLFGGTAHQQAAATQVTAANLQLQAARMQLAGGAAGGGLPGVGLPGKAGVADGAATAAGGAASLADDAALAALGLGDDAAAGAARASGLRNLLGRTAFTLPKGPQPLVLGPQAHAMIDAADRAADAARAAMAQVRPLSQTPRISQARLDALAKAADAAEEGRLAARNLNLVDDSMKATRADTLLKAGNQTVSNIDFDAVARDVAARSTAADAVRKANIAAYDARTAQALLSGSGADAGMLGRLGLAGRAVSWGAVAGSAVGGAFGGVSQYQDMRALGRDTAESVASGAFVGVGEAAISLFVPGGAVAVALAEGIRSIVNIGYNDVLEAQATRGTGLSDEAVKRTIGVPASAKADEYLKEAERLRREEWEPIKDVRFGAMGRRREELEREIEALERQGGMFAARAMKEEQTRTRQAQSDKEFMDWALAHGASRYQIGDPSVQQITNKTARGVPRVSGIENKNGGGRVIHFSLDLPPSDWERDLEEAAA